MLQGVYVVTGGAGLLGRAFASAIARAGGTAVIADVNATAAESVANAIAQEFPGRAQAAVVDITRQDSIDALIAQLAREYGRVQGVVNNAYPRSQRYGRKLEEVAYADFCENMNSHLGGYFLVAQRFSLHFRVQGGGSIVNIASIYGAMAPRFEVYEGTAMTMPVEYAAIKAGVIHLTRYFAQYFKRENIRVNCLSPGGILQNQPEPFLQAYAKYSGPKGMLAPTDVTGALVFLLSPDASAITGQNLIVDDGFSL